MAARGLGKGLDSLIPNTVGESKTKKTGTIVSLVLAVVIYAISIFVLKIFTKNEIYMIPYGNKLYKMLEKLGIYGENDNEQ